MQGVKERERAEGTTTTYGLRLVRETLLLSCIDYNVDNVADLEGSVCIASTISPRA